MHSLAVAAGALIIAAAAHVSIAASGGYASQAAPLQIAVALGIVVGAICCGRAWRERRFAVGFCLIVALAASEAFAVIMTAERTIAAREIASAPLRDAEAARKAAKARLEAAVAAKADAARSALTEAAKPGCRKECRTLIEGAKADTQREVDAARAAVDALPPVQSASPLADRLGIEGWALDLLTAALASIAANGLGAALVGFGAHGRTQDEKLPLNVGHAALVEPPKALSAPSARDHAVRFGCELLRPADEKTPVPRIHAAYLSWCTARGQQSLPAREIGAAMFELFDTAGLKIEIIDGCPHLCGAQLISPA